MNAAFGDYQTPQPLANRVCGVLADRGIRPASVLEPTCGTGTFLDAACQAFPSAQRLLGFDLNSEYVSKANDRLNRFRRSSIDVQVYRADFFQSDWNDTLARLRKPLLIIGNPPWVTSSDLTRLGSSNLPRKTNLHRHRGLDALTGKGNFDISEAMLLHALTWIEAQDASLAILCKTTVARKVLRFAWTHGQRLQNAEIRRIDAVKHFGVSVDACLFLVSGSPHLGEVKCAVYTSLEAAAPSSQFGLELGDLVADLQLYHRWRHLMGPQRYRWRSGVKHDCAKVMELQRIGLNAYVNGLQEEVTLERRFLFPMLKSSEVANGEVVKPKRRMLITQTAISDDTKQIESSAPQTWKYLCQHATWLDKRRSAVYKKRPRFSMFGVGPYTFSPWKVAISGFYKSLKFRVVGSFDGKPIVLDDTCYFVSCGSRDEAVYLEKLLHSKPAQELMNAFVFWDSKRPVTIEVLSRIDLAAVAIEIDAVGTESSFLRRRCGSDDQLDLFSNGVQFPP